MNLNKVSVRKDIIKDGSFIRVGQTYWKADDCRLIDVPCITIDHDNNFDDDDKMFVYIESKKDWFEVRSIEWE